MKKSVATSLLILFLGVLLSAVPLSARAQCTLCKSVVESSRTEKDGYDPTGLNKGIFYLMTVPYLLIGTVGFLWYRNSQKNKDKANS